MAGRSRLGTIFTRQSINQSKNWGWGGGWQKKIIPKKPSPSRSSSGSEISALTPQTIVVFPIRTSADPFAVEMEPKLLIHRKTSILEPLLE